MSRSGVLSIAMAGLLPILHGGVPARAQTAAEVVGPTEQIPRDGFKTWALFLVCNPDWVSAERSGDLANLYWRFKAFGDAIGSDNLAVWFWKARLSVLDPSLAENVDVPRSAEFCRALQLRPTAGPFLVITSAFPDVTAFPADRAVFELGSLDPVEIARLLNALTDQLLLDGRMDAVRVAAAGAGESVSPAPTSLWIRLLEGARRTMVGFGCKLKMRIDTGLLSAELRECAG